MNDGILGVLKLINDLIIDVTGNADSLVGGMSSLMPTIYAYTKEVMEKVVLPVAYSVLALFFVLELYKLSTKAEGMGGGTGLGAEVVIKTIIKVVICKYVVDSIPIILNSIYDLTQHLTVGIKNIRIGGSSTGGIDIDVIKASIAGIGFFEGLAYLVLCIIILLVVGVAVVLANIILVTRFIELYIYFAIAPIPMATFPSEEMSQIGKSFLKHFAAVCLQGTLIYLVLTFYPLILNSAFLDSVGTVGIIGSLMGVMGYSIVLIMAVFSTGRWAKAICNAM